MSDAEILDAVLFLQKELNSHIPTNFTQVEIIGASRIFKSDSVSSPNFETLDRKYCDCLFRAQ